MKWIVLHEKRIAAVVCCCALIAAAAAVTVRSTVVAMALAQNHDYPIRRVQTQEKKIALTFDADTDDNEAQRILDVLQRYQVKCTFFAAGAWAEKYPQMLRRIADEGHEIGNHSDTHPHMNKLRQDAALAQMADCSRKIEAASGVRPALFRSPYGEASPEVVRGARSLSMTSVGWDIDSFDWRNYPPMHIANRVISEVKPGSIVLFQLGARNTAAALPRILTTLQSEGYEMVTVSRLIHQEPCIINETGEQIPTG